MRRLLVRPDPTGRREPAPSDHRRPSPHPASARSFTTSFATLAVLFAVTFASQLAGPSLPAWAHGQVDAHQVLWPQHWRFFAAAGAENIVVYRLDADGAPARPVLRPFNSPANLHGLSRHEYARYDRVVEIDRQVPSWAWHTCPGGTLAGCLPADQAPVTLPARDDDLCGRLLFTHETAGTRAVVRATSVSIPCPR